MSTRLARFSLVALLSFSCLLPAFAGAEDFAIRNGDTVVFLGDSITAARTYTKIIENYTLLRFPDRKVRFVNAGWGGDTAAGGLERLERDVFPHEPTVLIVMYGVNDIGWGMKADAEHKQRYLDGIRGIVKACKQRGVRVYICSAAVTAADPFKSETDFLQTMCDAGLEATRQLGGDTIKLQRGMREIQQRIWKVNEAVKDPDKKTSLHAADGVHLNDLGHLAMAFVILKELGAPADVSSLVLDVESGKTETEGCQISQVETLSDGVAFTRTDEGLPFNNGIFYALNYRFVPVHNELNRYMLTVKSLAPGRYALTVDGRNVGKFPAALLARGVNISSSTGNAWAPGGPWDAQAGVLKSLTEARHEVATALVLSTAWIEDKDVNASLLQKSRETNEQIETMQRQIAQPRPYRFVLRRIPDQAE